MDEKTRQSVIAAALTSNASMQELQNTLQQQEAPLSESQQNNLLEHPEKSYQALRKVGVTDQVWLKTVLYHHEHIDGTGYPRNLTGDKIPYEAKLLAVADRYAAMVSSRNYRAAHSATEALRKMFLQKGETHDEELSLLLIKELGIFPPGAFVVLENGETAVVVKRGLDSMCPIVASYISPRGGPYANPLRRECHNEQHRIKEMCKPDKSIPLNLPRLWGYKL